MKKGLHSESNESLLASLLGIPAENLSCKRLSDILFAPLSIKGIGVKKASKLYIIKEIVRRIMEEEQPRESPSFNTPEDVAKYFAPLLIHESKEHFMIALLSIKHQLLATPTISIGSISAAIVHPREVFAETLKYPCASIILVHPPPVATLIPADKIFPSPVNWSNPAKLWTFL